MSHIKNKDSLIERIMRKALWDKGYRYRKNYEKLPGKPDIILKKYKIAIFCDSEFFHGKDWENLQKQLQNGSNPEFWTRKIKRNIERDEEVDRTLSSLGWRVIRFWGKDIKNDVAECVRAVEEAIFEMKTLEDS
jgi:DNA mismatch endonuclease (patch repair protein)